MHFVNLIVLLFAFSANLFCQDLPPFVLRKSITVDNGLIQSSVSAIVQDKSGYLWLGTQKGVSRWNGKEITNFSEENGLTKNNVRSLFCRANGDVVIGTFSGVSVFGKNGMITLRDPENRLSDKIYAIYETNDSSLVFGTDKNGVVVLKNNKFTYLNKESGLASNSIVAIIEDDAGSILFGSKNNGMSVLTKGIITNVNISHGLVSNGIISFLKDNDGSILITADAGICRYNKGKINTIIRDEKLNFVRGKNSSLAGDGTSYFVSRNSMHQLVNGVFSKVPLEESAPIGFSCLHVSDNGTFFVGTSGEGLRVYKKPFVLTLDSKHNFAHQDVFSISEDRTGNFFIATLGSGIGVLNGKFKVKLLTTNDGLASNSFYRILSANDGKTYFGSADNGISVYHNGRISTPRSFDVFNRKRIFAIYEALDSSIYFCPPLSVWRLKNTVLEDFGKTIGLENKKVDAVCNARDGSLYFAVENLGLLRVKSGEIELYNKDQGLTDYDFYSVVEGHDGTIYIGTDAGLFLLRKNGSIGSLRKTDGLSENAIYSIVEDNSGKVYLATNKGINIVDFSSPAPLIRYLGKEDGFASNEFNEKAVYKDSFGRIWFGTVQGVSCYFPSLDRPQRSKPYARLSSFFYSGEKTGVDQRVEIDESAPHIQIHYEGIDVDSPEKITYLYRVRGQSDNWTRTASSSLNFDHLPSGSYTFELVSQNSWSVKSDIASVDFLILSPLWRRWWMLAILAIVVSSAGYYLFVFRRRQGSEALMKKGVALHSLSKRENEIIRCLLAGESYKTISEKLFISPATVQSHIKNIYRKLDIHSKYELFNTMRKEDEVSGESQKLE